MGAEDARQQRQAGRVPPLDPCLTAAVPTCPPVGTRCPSWLHFLWIRAPCSLFWHATPADDMTLPPPGGFQEPEGGYWRTVLGKRAQVPAQALQPGPPLGTSSSSLGPPQGTAGVLGYGKGSGLGGGREGVIARRPRSVRFWGPPTWRVQCGGCGGSHARAPRTGGAYATARGRR